MGLRGVKSTIRSRVNPSVTNRPHLPLSNQVAPIPTNGENGEPSVNMETLILLLLGSGGTGALALIGRGIKAWKDGKAESEEQLVTRLHAEDKRSRERATIAERRADEAEARVEKEMEARRMAQEHVAVLRAILLTNGITPPRWPPDGGEM